MRPWTGFLAAGLLFGMIGPASAASFPRDAGIFLVSPDDEKLRIGSVTFSHEADGTAMFMVDLDETMFTEHFLSMRPFRCIETAQEWYCHLPYPYALTTTVSADDLTDLEYNLLFIRKLPSEFGIDAWNGLYYDLSVTGEGMLSGILLEGDLNPLASPPDSPDARPIKRADFIEADVNRRAFPRLVIE